MDIGVLKHKISHRRNMARMNWHQKTNVGTVGLTAKTEVSVTNHGGVARYHVKRAEHLAKKHRIAVVAASCRTRDAEAVTTAAGAGCRKRQCERQQQHIYIITDMLHAALFGAKLATISHFFK